MRTITLVLAVAITVAASAAQATNIAILNPDFALDVIAPSTPNNAYNGAIVDWSGGGVLSTDPALAGSFAGVLSDSPVDPDHQNAWSNGATTSQTLATNLQANTTYTLSAYVGNRSDSGAFPGGALDLGYGSTVGNNLLTGTVVSSTAPGAGGWSLWTTTFVTGIAPAGLGQPLRIDLVANGIQAQFDHIVLDSVPEPSALVLCGLGAAGLLVAARRRKG